NNYTIYTKAETYSYTGGYRFKPVKNGKIVKLGGYFTGTRVVKVWDASTKQLLASATVTGQNGQWVYSDITPLSVTAGTTYTIGVYMDAAGSSYAGYISSIPESGDIEITSAMRGSGDGIPTGFISGWMYGMVDIMFEPN
ncbi:MAG TPA: DUF4082 domain-containing protein, partial [Candidatus Bathyarchaeia archaeon]|nr:DUF4082 domain-containing protein [Candidatus Bathyarchaeia archaeon]